MIYEPAKRRKRNRNREAIRAAAAIDPSNLPSRYDPLQRRMKGLLKRHGNVPFDMAVISEIAPNLYLGGSMGGMVLPHFIKHVVSLYPDGTYTIGHEIDSKLVVKMADSEEQDLSHIDTIARWINECRQSGSILVYCSAGLNRGGVVVARALILEGMKAPEAIGLIRQKRSPACLCNKAFEKWLLDFA